MYPACHIHLAHGQDAEVKQGLLDRGAVRLQRYVQRAGVVVVRECGLVQVTRDEVYIKVDHNPSVRGRKDGGAEHGVNPRSTCIQSCKE